MKIAYIFHGHSRTWQQTHESFFENVFSVAPGDIFIHTWGDCINPKISAPWNGWTTLNENQLAISSTKPDLNGIFQTYKPKIMIVEEDPGPDITLLPEEFRSDLRSPGNVGVKNMLRSARTIFEAATKYKKYDKIFNTRLDIKYNSKLTEIEILSDKLLSPPSFGHIELWMFGTTEQIDKKTNFVNHIDKYWYHNPQYLEVAYELTFITYMLDQGIPVNSASNLQYEIIRPF